MVPQIKSRLLEYIYSHDITRYADCEDGALFNTVHFPLAVIETQGAILFADLPGYSATAARLRPAECAYMTSHFFSWFEGSAGRHFGGVIDKFIGDELMVAFLPDLCPVPPLEAALWTAKAMLDNDAWGFNPKIGIAEGDLGVVLVGSVSFQQVTAIGHAVNLAARCTQTAKGGRSIRIATSDRDMLLRVFGSANQSWHICPTEPFTPKNMPSTEVVDIRPLSVWVPNFDYIEHVRAQVEVARSQGAVKRQRPNESPPAGGGTSQRPH